MTTIKIISAVVFIIGFSTAFSQISVNALDCGLTYFYDNVGNRIARVNVICGPPSAKTDTLDENNAAMQVPNSKSEEVIADIELGLLYPNPTTGKLTVTFNRELTSALVTVTDNLGKNMVSFQTSGSVIPIDISGLSSGVYFVTVKTEKKRFSETVIKQ